MEEDVFPWKILKYKSGGIFFILGDSPASEFLVQSFRNNLLPLHRSCEQEKQE